jgi:hypothetical protein
MLLIFFFFLDQLYINFIQLKWIILRYLTVQFHLERCSATIIIKTFLGISPSIILQLSIEIIWKQWEINYMLLRRKESKLMTFMSPKEDSIWIMTRRYQKESPLHVNIQLFSWSSRAKTLVARVVQAIRRSFKRSSNF